MQLFLRNLRYLSNGNSATFIAQSESSELGIGLERFHADWLLNSNAGNAYGSIIPYISPLGDQRGSVHLAGHLAYGS